MIHKELLSRIAKLSITPETNVVPSELATALMAVVEMHYPHEITWAVKQPFIACYSCAEEYPCPTIETIIEELA